MVGEAHLVGVADIFNVKHIIHECGLPTICRLPPGTCSVYTGLQYLFRKSPNESISFRYSLKQTYYTHTAFQLLYAMCVDKRKKSNK